MDTSIYGLEFNARSLAAQQDTEDICFFIGTQIITGSNQIHMVKIEEDSNKLHSKIFSFDQGEIWKLTSSPNDKSLLASVYTSAHRRSSDLIMCSTILRLPDDSEISDSSNEIAEFADIEVLDTEPYGFEIKTTEFHPSNASLLASVVDGKIILFNRTEAKSKVVTEIASKKFSGGMWGNANQFVAIIENGIRGFDIREPNHSTFQIDEAHNQPVRTIDINPNKAFHMATGGDDGILKIWDARNSKEPVFSKFLHQHWIFSVCFNKFHDQLLLTSSSDGKVLMTSATSCSSEAPKIKNDMDEDDEYPTRKKTLNDGVLETFSDHEESVYCVEWSTSDPWTFASLSFDGKLIFNRVPKKYKYQILL